MLLIQHSSSRIDKLSNLLIATLNIRSIHYKSAYISELITDNHIDILSLTETRHSHSDDLPLRRSIPPRYSIMDLPRDATSADTDLVNHGGLALLYRSNYIARRIQLPIKPLTFEVLVCSLRLAAISLVSVTTYRPGSRVPCNDFFLELTSLFEIITIYRSNLLISGDFNVHVDDINDNNGKRYAAILDSFDLTQHVCQPTHSCGHTLDLVITRSGLQPSSVNIDPPVYSNHGLVRCCLPLNAVINNCVNQYRTKLTRNWKQLDISSFLSVIHGSVICNYTLHLTMSATELLNTYQHTLNEILNRLAPAVNKTFKDRPLFHGLTMIAVTLAGLLVHLSGAIASPTMLLIVRPGDIKLKGNVCFFNKKNLDIRLTKFLSIRTILSTYGNALTRY